jgi:hypothetical protein
MIKLLYNVLALFLGSTYAMDRANWLSYYSEDLFEDIPMILGTHNSGSIKPYSSFAAPIWPWVKNQCHSITDQLKLGARFLDVRVSQTTVSDSPEIFCSHRFFSSLTLSALLTEVNAFLDAHPSEFVLLYLRADWDNRKSLDFSLVSKITSSALSSRLFTPRDAKSPTLTFPTPTPVAELRGRVVLFHDGRDHQVLQGQEVVSFDWTRSTAVDALWQLDVDGGLKKVREFFNFARPTKGKISGLVCDVFNLGTRKKVAELFKHTIKASIANSPASANSPGLIVVDFLDEEFAENLFRHFVLPDRPSIQQVKLEDRRPLEKVGCLCMGLGDQI